MRIKAAQPFNQEQPTQLVETWEDQAIRQAFLDWKREIKPPSWVWEAIRRQVRQMEPAQESQPLNPPPRA
jgi:hypothetical protein